MAYPTIVFNNSTGSDTAASGAGPATALTGSSASYAGSVVTLDGSPDLTDVATDGSHVLYLVTSTGRKFFTINAKDNGADTVTLDDAPAGTASGLTWAIGGKRSTLHNTDSKYLFTNDGKKGWVVEVQYTGTDYQTNGSAGSLTIASAWAGDANEVGFTLKGTGSQRPLIKCYPSTPGSTYNLVGYSLICDLKFQIENPGDVYGSWLNAQVPMVTIRNCDCYFNYDATQAFGIVAGDGLRVEFCRFTGRHSVSVDVPNGHPQSIHISDCYFEGPTGTNNAGIRLDTYYSYANVIERCVFKDCYWGIYLDKSSGVGGIGRYIRGNTFYNSPVKFANVDSCFHTVIEGNIFSHCDGTKGSGYAIVRPSTYTQTNMYENWNHFYSNTSGNIDNGSIGPNSTTGTDPGYVDAANDNFSIGTALKGLGAWGGQALGSHTSYPDPGAVQRQEPAGGVPNTTKVFTNIGTY